MNRVNVDDLEPSDDFLTLIHNGEAFTGLAYELDDANRLVSETNYLNGQKMGVSREFAVNGMVVKEQNFAFDALHGLSREWNESGALKSESQYELGICLSEKEWASDGSIARDFALDEGSSQFQILLKLRMSSIGLAVLTQ